MNLRLEPIGRSNRPAQKLLRKLNDECFDWGLTFNGTKWFLAKVGNDTVVGYCGLALVGNKVSIFRRVGVTQAWRGHGFQRDMIRLCIEMAQEKGSNRMMAYTYTDAVASMRNFITCGFRPRDMPRDSNPSDLAKLVCWELKI